MTLVHTFENAIREARKHEAGAQGAPLPPSRLNQVIIGPPRAGKTTLAQEYAEILAEEGLAADKPPLHIGCDQGLQAYLPVPPGVVGSENGDPLAKADGGVLIIDAVEYADARQMAALLRHIRARQAHILVFTASNEKTIEALLENKDAAALLPPRQNWTTLAQAHSREEAKAYRRPSPEERAAKRARLKSLMSGDVSLQQDIKPMKKITIVRKPPAS